MGWFTYLPIDSFPVHVRTLPESLTRVLTFGCAPMLSSNSTALQYPLTHAKWSGVSPGTPCELAAEKPDTSAEAWTVLNVLTRISNLSHQNPWVLHQASAIFAHIGVPIQRFGIQEFYECMSYSLKLPFHGRSSTQRRYYNVYTSDGVYPPTIVYNVLHIWRYKITKVIPSMAICTP